MSANQAVDVYQSKTLKQWCADNSQPFYISPEREGWTSLVLRERYSVRIKAPAVYAGRLVDAQIMCHGFVCTSDKALIYKGLTHRDYAPQDDLESYCVQRVEDKFTISLPSEMQHVEGECIFFGGRGNFGHFIYENLMRLVSASLIPFASSLPYAVYKGLPSRFYEFLDLAGVPESRRILIDPHTVTRFSRVWCASSLLYMGGEPSAKQIYWRPEGVQAIHNYMRARASVDKDGVGADRSILYITRGKSGWRRVVNESEVIACVQRYGGIPVVFHDLSARDQIRLIANAKAVITPVGAAGAVTFFAPHDCAVIELIQPSIAAFFGPLAFSFCLGQRYRRVTGRPATKEEIAKEGLAANSRENTRDADYHIDCASLEQALRELLLE